MDFALSIISGRVTTVPMSERPKISLICADLPLQSETGEIFEDSTESSEGTEKKIIFKNLNDLLF